MRHLPSKQIDAGSNPAERAKFRKRGRVVDRTCLENKQTLTGHVGSNPTASEVYRPDGGMVYALVLEASVERHGGSSPLLGTIFGR